MYKAVNLFFAGMLLVFQGYCLQYFYGSFLEGRLSGKWKNGFAAAAFYIVGRLLVIWLAPSETGDYRAAVGKLMLSLGILSVLALCFYKGFHLITIFLVAAFQAVADLSRYAVAILLGELGEMLLDLWNRWMENGFITSEKVFGLAVKGGVLGTQCLQYLAIALLMYWSLRRLVGGFQEKGYAIHRTELLFLLTPAAEGLLLCMLLRIIMITVEDSIPELLYDRYPVLILLLPAILLLALLSILCGVKLFQDMICRNREKSERIVLEKQIGGLQEHIEEMERVYAGIRSMKHDMGNTLSVIGRLSAGTRTEEREELQAYLSEFQRTFETLELRFRTGNTVVDTLLTMKYHEAVRGVPGLKMDADRLLFPQEQGVRSYDIGVILGNALDNAIEACKRLKAKEPEADTFIRLCSLQKGNFMILKVENSFDGHLAEGRIKDLPATGKPDKRSHGIGLANIRSTAEKYQGTMDFKAEGRVFILSVMLKNERKEETERR